MRWGEARVKSPSIFEVVKRAVHIPTTLDLGHVPIGIYGGKSAMRKRDGFRRP